MKASTSCLVWRLSAPWWILLGVAALLLGIIFIDGAKELLRIWSAREEYSHAYFIPLISAFLVWQRKDDLERVVFRGSWVGVGVFALGLVLILLGHLSAIFAIVHHGFVIAIGGLVLAACGWTAMRILWVPVVFLFFMIPLPYFLHNMLSGHLQLISSALGVAVVRAFGVSVLLEGNIIDLGSFKLQVVEACSGLRYLFPLMSFGFLCGYLFDGRWWERLTVFLSTIPLTILMNSFRIGVIGLMVEHWGTEMAQGFLHDFEGWVVFMACVGVLFLEIWLLVKLRGKGERFSEVFGLVFPAPTSDMASVQVRPLAAPYLASVFLLVCASVGVVSAGERANVVPHNLNHGSFPMVLEEWSGRRLPLGKATLEELKLTDYTLANYHNSSGEMVNFYTAYYSSQRAGESAHSPRSCIPGGGWKIEKIDQTRVPGVSAAGEQLYVNRVLIQKGDYRQLVYYWFQQRGRVLTNEYLVKWYLLRDGVIHNRTDGALVRLTTPVKSEEDWEDADARLLRFALAVEPVLDKYIPPL